jgi:hypothetical protein
MQDTRKNGFCGIASRVTLLALTAAFLPATAVAQLPRDLIEEALDQPVKQLGIQDQPIRDALAKIEQQTGLHFTFDEGVLDLMPYGARTRVSIVVRDMSVRAGLTQVFDGLGLQMLAQDGEVIVFPAPVLERLGRRIAAAEVALLGKLAGAKWNALKSGAESIPLAFRIDPADEPKERLERALAQVDGANALRQLEAACDALRWVWRVEDERLVFERRSDDIRRRLDWPLDFTYQREPLDRLLVDLGTRVGVLMKFEPGALQKVAARDRPVDLIQHGGTVRQTLERICGNTGLRYEIDDEGVQILGPVETEAGPTAATVQQWVRIEIEIRPGVKMDIFVRQDQLPPEFRELAQRKLQQILHGE